MVYEPKFEHICGIFLKEIVFEKDGDCTDVTIFAYYKYFIEELEKDDDSLQFSALERVDYCCQFPMLVDLLLLAKDNGVQIIRAIEDKLSDENDNEYPSEIDVENLFGQSLEIEDIILTVYKPMEENENGEWEETKDDLLYIIDSIESRQEFESKVDNLKKIKNLV